MIVSMINFKPGDIVLLDVPFTGGAQTKRRPALVALDTGDADIVVVRITSQARQDEFDVDLIDWRGAGLIAPSIVRVHKIATLEKNLVARTLGHITRPDRDVVAIRLV